MTETTQIRSHFDGREFSGALKNGLMPKMRQSDGSYSEGQYAIDTMDDIRELENLGIYLDRYNTPLARTALSSFGMDTIQGTQTTASVGTPIQFLQAILPGQVRIATTAMLLDEVLGVTAIGTFEDEQIIQTGIENLGVATLYADTSNVPMASFNQNFIYRDVVRYETGFEVSILEEKRSARMNISVANEKRISCTDFILERARNQVGYYGYNSGNNNTYGLLNEPNLPAYQTVAQGAVSGSRLWSAKTFLEIINDLLTAIQSLRTQTGEQINPQRVPLTLFCSTAVRDYLNKPTDFPGQTAMTWLKENYPTIRVMSAHELDGANGGANVFYLFADTISDGSTDGGRTFLQMVPTKFMVTGAVPVLKGYKESFANGLAGVLCNRPWAVYRASGM